MVDSPAKRGGFGPHQAMGVFVVHIVVFGGFKSNGCTGEFREILGNQVLQTFRIFALFRPVIFNRLDDEFCVHVAHMPVEHESTQNGKDGYAEGQGPDAILHDNGTFSLTSPNKRHKVGQHEYDTKEGAQAGQPYKKRVQKIEHCTDHQGPHKMSFAPFLFHISRDFRDLLECTVSFAI
jgi:hypothetical protein